MPNKILLIEDDSGITMALTDLLNAEDYRVETAADGLTGLARAREGNFDVIILDVMLPGKNGFDVCRDLATKYHDADSDADGAWPGNRQSPGSEAGRG
jgi:DNA-binding response OmpR family regulator